MNAQLQQATDLDSFYSSGSIQDWQQIIGSDLHYHFGYFEGSEDLQTGLKQTVRNLYPYIPLKASVLDIGCGWGGPAKMLVQERQCTVKGLTISTQQAKYCRHIGIDAEHQDVEKERIQGHYDLIFMMEALSHIRDKAALLRHLKSLAGRLVLSVNCIAETAPIAMRTTFGGSMHLCTVSELTQALGQAGWKIQFMQNRRFQSLRTAVLWQQNLEGIGRKDACSSEQFISLQGLVSAALSDPIRWCQSFPLIDIVAE